MPVPGQRPKGYGTTEMLRDRYRRQLAEAIAHLRRLVDHQDDECEFDHHGLCQAHFIDGSEPGKCGIVEAREFLARVEPPAPEEATGA